MMKNDSCVVGYIMKDDWSDG